MNKLILQITSVAIAILLTAMAITHVLGTQDSIFWTVLYFTIEGLMVISCAVGCLLAAKLLKVKSYLFHAVIAYKSLMIGFYIFIGFTATSIDDYYKMVSSPPIILFSLISLTLAVLLIFAKSKRNDRAISD